MNGNVSFSIKFRTRITKSLPNFSPWKRPEHPKDVTINNIYNSISQWVNKSACDDSTPQYKKWQQTGSSMEYGRLRFNSQSSHTKDLKN